MTLVAHLLRADLRHMRFVLVAWLVIVGANVLVEGIQPLTALDPNLREATAVVVSVLWLSQLLMNVVLVSLIVHAHPTVGTDAFWMTRPIPPQRLLAAKMLLLAGVLVLAPAIADAVLLAVYAVPVRTGAGVVAEGVEGRLVFAALLVVGAALTRDLARFALLCGATLLTVALGIGILTAVLLARLADASPFGSFNDGHDPTGQFVFNVLLVGAAVVTLAVQYETRLRSRSVAAGVAGFAAAVIVSTVWPVSFLAPERLVPAWAQPEGALSVTVDAATISTNTAPAFFSGRTLWSTVNGDIDVDGLPPGWSASIAVREAIVRRPDGEALRSEPVPPQSVLSVNSGDMAPHAVIRDVLGVSSLASVTPPVQQPRGGAYPVLFAVRRDELTRWGPTHGEYRSVVSVWLTRYNVSGVLAVRPGAHHRARGHSVVIDDVSRVNGDVTLVVREWRASSRWDRRPRATYSFYLRHRVRGEALSVSEVPMRGQFTLTRFLPLTGFGLGLESDGFVARALVLTVPPRYDAQAQTLIADDAWLEDAELVIVRTTQEGIANHTLEVPSLPLGTS